MTLQECKDILEKHKDKCDPQSYDPKEVEKIRKLLYWFADVQYKQFYEDLQKKLKNHVNPSSNI